MQTAWTVWPAVQFFNFKYVPLQFRLPVVCFVNLFWCTFLSAMTNMDDKEEEEEGRVVGVEGVPALSTL
jgi:hypothetical protein